MVSRRRNTRRDDACRAVIGDQKMCRAKDAPRLPDELNEQNCLLTQNTVVQFKCAEEHVDISTERQRGLREDWLRVEELMRLQ